MQTQQGVLYRDLLVVEKNGVKVRFFQDRRLRGMCHSPKGVFPATLLYWKQSTVAAAAAENQIPQKNRGENLLYDHSMAGRGPLFMLAWHRQQSDLYEYLY